MVISGYTLVLSQPGNKHVVGIRLAVYIESLIGEIARAVEVPIRDGPPEL